jgi:hypothetical protein
MNMNITSAKYIENEFKLGTNSQVKATIDGQEMSVPLDPANRHYQAILEWVEDGNTIEDAD